MLPEILERSLKYFTAEQLPITERTTTLKRSLEYFSHGQPLVLENNPTLEQTLNMGKRYKLPTWQLATICYCANFLEFPIQDEMTMEDRKLSLEAERTIRKMLE